jgi:hypothetical protein
MKKREGGMQMIVEGKKKEFFDEESSDEEVEEKSSLTVVLIDEGLCLSWSFRQSFHISTDHSHVVFCTQLIFYFKITETLVFGFPFLSSPKKLNHPSS